MVDTKKIYNILSLRSNHKLIKKWIIDNVVYMNYNKVTNVSIRNWKYNNPYVTIHVNYCEETFRFGTFGENMTFPIEYYVPASFQSYINNFYHFLLVLERKSKINELL